MPFIRNRHLSAKPTRTKNLSRILIMLAAIMALLGASAGAYYGVIIPNKPENVLRNAFPNTLNQKQTKFDGKITYESTNDKVAVKTANVAFSGATNVSNKTFQTTIEATAGGVKVPIEIRKVDTSLYFKVGDLASVKGLVAAASPTYGTIVDTVNQKIANQWVEIDETLLKQINADCVLNNSFGLTNADVELLQRRYEQIQFANVKSTSNETVNGRGAIKYEIEINDKKGAEYFNGLQDLSIVKQVQACTKSTANKVTPKADGNTTPLTLWVDKGSKRIVKIAGQTTAQDEAKNKTKANFEINLQYGMVSISKPEGAKPLMEILGDFTNLFGGLAGATSLPSLTAPTSTNVNISPECLSAIQQYANSRGATPIPSGCL